MKKVLTLSLAAIALCASPVFAKIAVAERALSYPVPARGNGCLTENAQISITFNGVEQDATTVKTKFDAKVAEIDKALKAAELDKYELQSMNYSINPQNYGNSNSMYQYNGTMSYTILPSSRATTVMEQLNKKGVVTSVNVNAYRNGQPCPAAPAN